MLLIADVGVCTRLLGVVDTIGGGADVSESGPWRSLVKGESPSTWVGREGG